jgi:hypothetical protein
MLIIEVGCDRPRRGGKGSGKSVACERENILPIASAPKRCSFTEWYEPKAILHSRESESLRFRIIVIICVAVGNCGYVLDIGARQGCGSPKII